MGDMKDFPTDRQNEDKMEPPKPLYSDPESQSMLDEDSERKEQLRIERQNDYYHNNKWMYCSMGTVVFLFVLGAIFGKGGTIFNGKSRAYFYNPYLSDTDSDSLVTDYNCKTESACSIRYDQVYRNKYSYSQNDSLYQWDYAYDLKAYTLDVLVTGLTQSDLDFGNQRYSRPNCIRSSI